MKAKEQTATVHVPSLLTVKQAAEHLAVGLTKVYELISQEGLPVVKFGRATRIHPEDLVKWMNERRAKSA